MECVCSTVAETVLNSKASGVCGGSGVTVRIGMGGITQGKSFTIIQRFISRIMVTDTGKKALTSVVLHSKCSRTNDFVWL